MRRCRVALVLQAHGASVDVRRVVGRSAYRQPRALRLCLGFASSGARPVRAVCRSGRLSLPQGADVTVRHLDALFQPKSVAVVGASSRAGSIGAMVWSRVLDGAFDGPVWPV